jgi:16S rRNA (cytosine967-C5)-methyltransferase
MTDGESLSGEAAAEAAAESGMAARRAALELLREVLGRRRPLDDALAGHAGLAALETRDRAFARLLVATCLRRLGQIDGLLARHLSKPLPARDAAVHDVLRLGTAQLVFLETPAHAAVHQSVALVEAAGFRRLKALVNAVLRRIAENGAALAAAQDAARLNTPDWLWRSWVAAYGETVCRAIAEAHLAEPPLDLTVPVDGARWAALLGANVLPTGTLRRAAGGAVSELPGYGEGAWWVQDAAAALPARLLGDVAGRTVVDICAAPGGKTAQLAAAGARVIAVDRSATRLKRLEENLRRLKLTAETVAADGAEWRPQAPLPFVLLDAPCASTGAIRRHPDVPRLKTPQDVARLTVAQDRLLAAASLMLAPGGVLVYCVCSLEAEEGPERVAALMAMGAPVKRLPIKPSEVSGLVELITADGDLRTLPCHLPNVGGMDGFYAARLVRL